MRIKYRYFVLFFVFKNMFSILEEKDIPGRNSYLYNN